MVERTMTRQIVLLLVLFLLLMVGVVVSTADSVEERKVIINWNRSPECLSRCSDQVKCSVTMNFQCNSRLTTKFETPTSPVSMQHSLIPTQNGTQKLLLTWNAPKDGSYRDLERFTVFVRSLVGFHSQFCYIITPDPLWHQAYEKNANSPPVMFYLDCIEVPLWETPIELSVILDSEPRNTHEMESHSMLHIIIPEVEDLHKDRKRIHVPKTICFPPLPTGPEWQPGFEIWIDYANVFHLIIRKPVCEAFYYDVQLNPGDVPFSVENLHLKHTVGANFSVTITETGKNFTCMENPEGYLHFLLPGVQQNKEYRLHVQPMFRNKSIPRYTWAETGSFLPKVKGEPIRPKSEDSGEESDNSPDNSLTIIVCVIVIVLVVLVVSYVLIKMCRGSCMRRLSCVKLLNNSGNNSGTKPKALVIFYKESENFVKAVESHIVFLRHYVDIVSIHEPLGGMTVCCPVTDKYTWIDRDIKERAILIYMSPSIHEMIVAEDFTCSPESASVCDEACLYALQSVQRNMVLGSAPVIHLVTLNCFNFGDNATALPLRTFPQTRINLPVPLEAARQEVRGQWKLTEIEPLLCRFYQVRDFPNTNRNLMENWRNLKGVSEAEHHISVCGRLNGCVAVQDNHVNDQTPLRQHISEDHMDYEYGGYMGAAGGAESSLCEDFEHLNENETIVVMPPSPASSAGVYQVKSVERPPPYVSWSKNGLQVYPPSMTYDKSASTDTFYSDLNKVNACSGWE